MEIKPVLTLDSKEPLSKAVSELAQTGTAVIVTKKGKYYGTIDDRSLGYGFDNAGKTFCERVIEKPPTLSPSSDVIGRINAFLLGHFKALPVIKEETRQVLGITTRVELLQDMLDEKIMPKNRVSDLMNTPVYTIDEEKTIADAKNLMKEYGCNRLVVTSSGRPIGALSTLDLAAKKAFHRTIRQKRPMGLTEVKSLDGSRIKDFFRPDITVVKETDTVEDAAKKMIGKEVSSVVVVANDKPAGVLSAVDLFRMIQKEAEGEMDLVVSGLGEENMMMYPYVKDKIASVLDKFSDSFNIRNGKVHVKEDKKTVSINIYFDTDEGHVSLNGERATIKQTIDELSQELDKVLQKKKEMRRVKPRARNYGGESGTDYDLGGREL